MSDGVINIGSPLGQAKTCRKLSFGVDQGEKREMQ
jgi:hypothetical protein